MNSNVAWKHLKATSRWWRPIVGMGLMGALVFVAGPSRLADVLGQASLTHVMGAAILLYAWLLLGCVKVWLLLRSQVRIRFSPFLKIYASSWAISLLLPSQLGDATQVLFLRREGVPVSVGGAAYLVDKVLSLFWMLLVAGVGVGLYAEVSWVKLCGLVLVACLGALALWKVSRPFADREWGRFEAARDQLRRISRRTAMIRRHRGVLSLNAAMTVVKWLVLSWIYLLAFAALGTGIGWAHAATLPIMSSLVAYLPISVGGAGTMEWTAAALFGSFGISTADVLGAYLMLRGLLLLSAFCVLSAVRLRDGIPLGEETVGPKANSGW